MNNLETILFPVTGKGEAIFRLFYKDGRVGKVDSSISLDEVSVRAIVKDAFIRIPEVSCIEVTSPRYGYTATFPRCVGSF